MPKIRKNSLLPVSVSHLLMLGRILALAHSAHAAWTQAPVVIKVSDAVKPGELISINGEGIDSATVGVAMKPDADGSSPSTPPSGSLIPEIIQKDSRSHFVIVRFPGNALAGVYNVWVKNSHGWGQPVKLNAPRALYQSEYEAWRGQSIAVVGRNFDGAEFGAAKNMQVRLRQGSSTCGQTILEANPFCVTFTVGNPAPGTYTIEIS